MEENSWHLSKGIPIGLILALVLQSGAILWWSAKIDSQVTNNKAQIEAQTTEMIDLKNQQSVFTAQISNDITRIKTILEFSDVNIEFKQRAD